jgi:hydrogenase expression/formation protein HypC
MCLAVPGQITSIINDDPLTRQGKVRFGEVLKLVSLVLVPQAEVGDFVIVHAGFAIETLDVAAATEVFRTLEGLS